MKFVVACLAVALVRGPAPAQQPAPQAGERPLARIQETQKVWDEKKVKCASCHHQFLPELVQAEARGRGVRFDAVFAAAVTQKSFAGFLDLDEIVQGTNFIDVVDDAWRLLAAHAAGVPHSLSTSAIAQSLAGTQRPDGSWRTMDARPPSSYSRFTATAVAARGVALYMPPQQAARKGVVLRRAAGWLARNPPATTEDRAFQLLGLFWTNADEATRKPVVAALKAAQAKDGGWSQLAGEKSDAYSTGTALYALHHGGGMPVADPVYAAGAKFLLGDQKPDGTWRVESRLNPTLPVSPGYFNSGFPHEREHQFSSITGTAWATLALLPTLPAVPPKNAPPVPDFAPPEEKAEWVRAALNGTAADLKKALDGGMNPNSKTKAGTTALMLAACDRAKVELLVAAGANVDARADTGITPLVVAARYYDSAATVGLLLKRGAAVNPPPGVAVRNNATALFVAATAGNPEVLRQLIGAKANVEADMKVLGKSATSPLRTAVQRGDVPVVQLLLDAKAAVDRSQVENITPLHIAVVANHADVVKALLAGGAKVNAADDEKTTALHYAAYANFPDTAVAEVLLAAGADRALKDATNRTPLEVAKAFGRAKLVALLGAAPRP